MNHLHQNIHDIRGLFEILKLKFKEIKKVTRAEIVFALLGSILVMFAFLIKTKTIVSGYHFMDDHELIRYRVGFANGKTVLDSLVDSWRADISWRYRPFYWVERVILSKLFGDNLFWWNIFTAIKGAITLWLCYLVARFSKLNIPVSALFSALIIFGTQFAPWYRSANQENTGLLFCMLAFLMLAMQYYSGTYKGITNVGLCIAAVLAGMTKESFTLFMPAFVLIKFWTEFTNTDQKFWACIRYNLLCYLIIGISCLINVIVITFFVGTDQVSYAGFHEGTAISEYINGMTLSLTVFLKTYFVFGCVVGTLMMISLFFVEQKNRIKYLIYILIGLFVMLVQLLAHAKAIMYSRYVIPWIVGYAFVFVMVAYNIFKKNKIMRIGFVLALSGVCLSQMYLSYREAQAYAYDGRVVNQYFEDLESVSESTDYIVCAFEDEELNFSTECWMQDKGYVGITDYNFDNGEFYNMAHLTSHEIASSWEQVQIVVCYLNNVEEMIERLGCREGEYELHQHDNYCIICRK